jgi:hypothetical protein
MKLLLVAISLLLLFTAALAQSPAQTEFTQLKSLAGAWEGKTRNGEPVKVDYQLTAGGSALMSTIHEHGDMISLFHLDGADKLLLTHYCSMGNQPRMVASASPDGKTVRFKFLDATNLSSPDAGRMDSVVIAMAGPDHHTEEWNFKDHDKVVTEVFDLQRTK